MKRIDILAASAHDVITVLLNAGRDAPQPFVVDKATGWAEFFSKFGHLLPGTRKIYVHALRRKDT